MNLDQTKRAACRRYPVSMFFVERGASSRPARLVCNSECPVDVFWTCRYESLERSSYEQSGIAGGLSPAVRVELRRRWAIVDRAPMAGLRAEALAESRSLRAA